MIRHLDTIYMRVLGLSSKSSIDDMEGTLQTYHNLYETAIESVKRMKWIGNELDDDVLIYSQNREKKI